MGSNSQILIASLGGVIEYIDYTLMIFLAPVLAHVFFASDTSSSISLLAIISTFVTGYFCRPFGGVIFSHMGDRLGRKRAFLLTIIVMSLSTFCLGLLPGYSQAGVLALLLLIGLRMLQGFSFGGDMSTTIPYVLETARRKDKFMAGGLLIAIINIGILLSSLLSTFIHSVFPSTEMQAYGWRLLFIGAGVIGFIAIPLRLKLKETAEFSLLQQSGLVHKTPLVQLLRQYPRQLLLVFTGVLPISLTHSYVALLLPLHLEKLTTFNTIEIQWANVVGNIMLLLSIIAFARWANWKNFVRIIHTGLLLSIVVVFPLIGYLFLSTQLTWFTLFLVYAIASVITGMLLSCLYVYISLCFPCALRCSAVALTLNIAVMLSGLSLPVLTGIAIYWAPLPVIFLAIVNSLSLVSSFSFLRQGWKLNYSKAD